MNFSISDHKNQTGFWILFEAVRTCIRTEIDVVIQYF